ncbi:MAG: LysR substrate-binding domain-containing protein [Gemmobacter sp.]
MNTAQNANPLLQRGLKIGHLRLLAALSETGQISRAAREIGISQPAASRLLAEIEHIAGQPVHQRTGRGMSLTAVGQSLAMRARRIQMELRDAARDIDEAAAGQAGHVRIGSVTGPAIDLVLPVIRNARMTAPRVTFEVVVAPSDILCETLLAGRIDFAIGRLPEGPGRGMFAISGIGTEPVDLVVRRGHPLALHPNPAVRDLLAYDWIMPPAESLLTRTVLARLRAAEVEAPPQRLSTASFLLTFALIQQSNAIAPLSRAVAARFCAAADGSHVRLAVDLGIEVEPFGLVTRADALLPPAAGRIAADILALARQGDG